MRKPGIWDIFVKVEFDVWLISSIIELSFRPTVRFNVEIQHFGCDHTPPPIIDGPKALLCTRMAFLHTMHEMEIS